MSTLHPFPALRPPRELAARVSSLPYDVMNHREAREMAAGNDASFLHICRSDIDTSETAIHAPETYAKARETWKHSSARATSSGMKNLPSTFTARSCGAACRRASSAAPPWMNTPATSSKA